MNPMNQEPGTFVPAPEVWPPPPSVSQSMRTSPVMAIESLRVQSVWLVFFLTVITFGIYAVFWLKRQITAIRTIRLDRKPSPLYANIVLAMAFIDIGLNVASGINSNTSLDMASNILNRIYGIMLLVLTFQVRNAMNKMMPPRNGDPYWFSGVFTWLFGTIYLQYKINKNNQRWQNEQSNSTGY